jgi:hypothetical protein
VRVGSPAAWARALRAPRAGAALSSRERLDERLQKAGRACGCSSGALAALVATTAVVVWWALARDGRVVLWPEAAVAALVVVGAAIGGKLAGLAAAEVWLRWLGRGLR